MGRCGYPPEFWRKLADHQLRVAPHDHWHRR
jgi:hypothetical protein